MQINGFDWSFAFFCNWQQLFDEISLKCFIVTPLEMSLIMRKSAYAICDQQRYRSACASVQSDQHLCCSLPREYNISSFYICNFMTLSSFLSWADRFESYLVKNLEDRFSRDEAQMGVFQNFTLCSQMNCEQHVTICPHLWVCKMLKRLFFLYLSGCLKLLVELPHDKTNKMTCVPSEDSDQPGHPPSLISLRCLSEESLGPKLPLKYTAKTLIRLGGCHFVGFVMRWLSCLFLYQPTLNILKIGRLSYL